jgi:phospholipase A1
MIFPSLHPGLFRFPFTKMALLASLLAGSVAADSPSLAPAQEAPRTAATPMQARWELTADTRQEPFMIRPHHPNYLVVKFTDDPNDQPFRELKPIVGTQQDSLDKQEVEFQLSFKIKLVEDLLLPDANLWMGYTQESFWQVFNDDVSNPFRETNYAPEFIWVAPLTLNWGELQFRYLSLGIVHQSNGRAEPLSRSWDRVFAEVGAEIGNLALVFKPWWRIPESDFKDDNPEIEEYIGRGELTAMYNRKNHLYSLRLRNNFSTGENRGSVTAEWSFPLAGSLRGYVRGFSGYGESMIDYNWRQDTLGVGLALTF